MKQPSNTWGVKAVFLDDPAMLATVQQYFKTGAGNGRLVNYIIDPAGECQESGRDQGQRIQSVYSYI